MINNGDKNIILLTSATTLFLIFSHNSLYNGFCRHCCS